MNRALIVYSVDNSINGCLSRKDRYVMAPSSGGVGKVHAIRLSCMSLFLLLVMNNGGLRCVT